MNYFNFINKKNKVIKKNIKNPYNQKNINK